MYQQQAKEGNRIQEDADKQLERDEKQRRNERDADDRNSIEED